MDLNWFYSTLAQSSAAIVGILGAFLTTKIINTKLNIDNVTKEILATKSEIEFLERNIEDKEDYVIITDYEADTENVVDFLESIELKINLDKPYTIDELIELGNEDEETNYHDLNRKILSEKYTEKYLNFVAEKQNANNNPFLRMQNQIKQNTKSLYNSLTPINKDKWNTYNNYKEQITETNLKIIHLQELNKIKENDILKYKKATDSKKILLNLAALSLWGVFAPLFLIISNTEMMLFFRYYIFFGVLFIWVCILFYFYTQIIKPYLN